MAYLDGSTDINRRLTAAVAVAVLQSAAIVAIVNGLAVRFIAQEPEARVEGRNIEMPLPPPPPSHDVEADPRSPQASDTSRQVLDTPRNPVILPLEPPSLSLPEPLLLESTTDFVRPVPQPTQAVAPLAARPRNDPQGWASANDYPARELREGAQGLVRYSLSIGADGHVTSCVVTASSGHPGLDQATCRLIARRARFEPATDSDGGRVTGSYAGSVRWMIPGG